jgi:hypothetical protein
MNNSLLTAMALISANAVGLSGPAGYSPPKPTQSPEEIQVRKDAAEAKRKRRAERNLQNAPANRNPTQYPGV